MMIPFYFRSYRDHRIQAGKSFIPKRDDGLGVAQFHMFPGRDQLRKCFCMMKLEKKLILGPQIQKTPFIAAGQQRPSKIKKWLVAGWGRTVAKSDMDTNYWSQELRATLARIVEDCGNFYPDANEDKTLFCLGSSENEMTSSGDQGGPVYSIEEDVVYGMIINGDVGKQDAEINPNKPMLMAELHVAKDWIDWIRVHPHKPYTGDWKRYR